uniref:Uncharacterized protein n=1 Tax=Globodera rostochiensis TaxID=31243 RepID=A0A914GXG2_GLORO
MFVGEESAAGVRRAAAAAAAAESDGGGDRPLASPTQLAGRSLNFARLAIGDPPPLRGDDGQARPASKCLTLIA